MMSVIESFFNDCWYKGRYRPFVYFLLPLSLIYHLIIVLRQKAYEHEIFKRHPINAPVIVVGNITVGGTGKTPLVIWLAGLLMHAGYKPGIVTRGYGGRATMWPQQVRPDSDPIVVGDEALMMAINCKCPVAVDPDRHEAANALIAQEKCDVIITDDGLQHYAFERDIEIAVIDGIRRFGNCQLLPAGPLREPVNRLDTVDVIISNGFSERGEFSMTLKEKGIYNLCDDKDVRDIDSFKTKTVHAIAGIGNPERFFTHLKKLGLDIIKHPFPNHHKYRKDDIIFDDDLDVLMTEKDAVKCRRFANTRHWYVKVVVKPQEQFTHKVLTLLKDVYVQPTEF